MCWWEKWIHFIFLTIFPLLPFFLLFSFSLHKSDDDHASGLVCTVLYACCIPNNVIIKKPNSAQFYCFKHHHHYIHICTICYVLSCSFPCSNNTTTITSIQVLHLLLFFSCKEISQGDFLLIFHEKKKTVDAQKNVYM